MEPSAEEVGHRWLAFVHVDTEANKLFDHERTHAQHVSGSRVGGQSDAFLSDAGSPLNLSGEAVIDFPDNDVM